MHLSLALKKTALWMLAAGALALCFPTHAGTSRAELMFDATAAVKAHDRSALLRCVNFEGANEETVKSTLRILDTILTWPSAVTKESERTDRGPVEIRQNGRTYRLNGEWTSQVHFVAQSPTGGTAEYVFPAGVANGKYRILLAVPIKSAKD